MKILALFLVIPTLLCGSPIPDFPFLYVVGQVYEEFPTKSAKITFSVQAESEKAEEGERVLKDASKLIMKMIRDTGVKDAEIDASEVRKHRVSEKPFNEEQRQVYYSFTQQFIVKISDLKIYPTLTEKLIGSNEVSSFDSEFFPETSPEITMRLRKAAFKDAKDNANGLAEASGEKIGRIHSASEVTYEEMGRLMGETRGGFLPSSAAGRDKVYEVPPTVPHFFQVFVLYRLAGPDNAKSEQDGGGKGEQRR